VERVLTIPQLWRDYFCAGSRQDVAGFYFMRLDETRGNHESGEQLVRQLPDAAENVHGSLLHRKMFHGRGRPKCRRGEGHRVWVLTVSYPGGQTGSSASPPTKSLGSRSGSRTTGNCEPNWRPFGS
jgi:hypothetical protein